MGRQVESRVRRLIAAALALAACGAPPGDGPIDAGREDAAPPRPDARPGADAAPADAGPAPDADPDNPLGIRLTEVTDLLPQRYYGGRASPDPWGVGSGVALGDVDGDGDLDVVLARTDEPPSTGGPPVLLRNGGGFAALSEDAAFSAALAGVDAHAAALGDYDGDGDLDLFLACNGADLLLENDGGGSFADVTAAAGVAGPADDVSVGAVWADVTGDGLLDLYVVQYAATAPPVSDPRNANRLYVNDGGDGRFTDVTASAGAAGDGASQAALISDLDGDGDLEIYVANDRFAVDGGAAMAALDPDAYYALAGIDGAGAPSFAERGDAVGVTGPRSSMGVALTDLDGDGFDDLYVTDFGANHVQVWKSGAGTYDTDAGLWNLAVRDNPPGELMVSWGARFVDLDRDGWDELFVVNGSISEPIGCDTQYQLDTFLRRAPGAASFVEITGSVGLPAVFVCPAPADTPLEGRGAVTGDLDGDGDDDLVVSGYVEPYRFYRNDTPQADRHRLRVRLVGSVSGPDPVGAVLQVTLLDGRKLRRTLYGGGDTHSQSARVLEVGLGADTAVTEARVVWPSGLVQAVAPPVDATATVTEPAWLALSKRAATDTEDPPVLTYTPVDATGAPIGPSAAGRAVTATRSDGVPVSVIDAGDGTYSALLPHPGAARITTLAVTDAATPVRPRLTISYR